MPRIRRCQQRAAGIYFHVMNRGHYREALLATDEDRACFLELLARYRKRFPLRLFHYCLMGNHFHLLVGCEEPRELSPWMAGLLRSYMHYYHRRTGFVGPLLQGRFKSLAVAVERYFLSCARYVERNPVEAGIVSLPWEYRWSSCRAYALAVADPLLSYHVWYQELGRDTEERQRRWREFLLGNDLNKALVRRGAGPSATMPTAGACSARRRGRPPGAAAHASRRVRRGFSRNSMQRTQMSKLSLWAPVGPRHGPPLGRAVTTGRPFGTVAWVERTGQALGIELTNRHRGRPQKLTEK